MNIEGFDKKCCLHDSSIEFASFNDGKLVLNIQLCNWAQDDYKEGEPEIVLATFVFNNVEKVNNLDKILINNEICVTNVGFNSYEIVLRSVFDSNVFIVKIYTNKNTDISLEKVINIDYNPIDDRHLRSKKYNGILLSSFPELEKDFKEYTNYQDKIYTGSTLVYDDVFCPFIIKKFKMNDKKMIERFSEHFESLAELADYEDYAKNLLLIDVFDNLMDDVPELELHLKDKSLSLYTSYCKYQNDEFIDFHKILKVSRKDESVNAYKLDFWKEELNVFIKDIDRTISFILTECSDIEFAYLGEIFPEIVQKTNSKKFVDAIKYRFSKISNIANINVGMLSDIKDAESWLH